MNVDGSNKVSIYAGSGVSGPRWIPGTDSIIFGEYSDDVFKRINVSVVDGEVVVGEVEDLFYSPDSYKASWHWGPNGGEILFYREPDQSTPGAYTLEILDLSTCPAPCESEIIYQSPEDYELNWPIRSHDGTKVWAIEANHDSFTPTADIIEVDLSNDPPETSVLKSGLTRTEDRYWQLAQARTFNGFAFSDGGNTYIYNDDLDQPFSSSIAWCPAMPSPSRSTRMTLFSRFRRSTGTAIPCTLCTWRAHLSGKRRSSITRPV